MKIRLGQERARDILNSFGWMGYDQVADLLESPLGCEFTIEPVKPKHTESQRNYYWRSLEWWLRQVGYSAREAQAMKEKVHYEVICCEAYGVEKVVNFRGVATRIPKETSSKQSIEKYGLLIETMLRLAVEGDGTVIPPPEESP